VSVVYGMQVDNAEFGKGSITFENRGETWIAVPGAQYVGEMGFLSSPEAMAEVQRVWNHRTYGGGNWRGLVVVRMKVGWVACPASATTCYEDQVSADEGLITHQIYLHPDVWVSLVNDYRAGGLSAVIKNPHYEAIQKVVFESYCSITPQVPCIGFSFKKVG